MWSSLTADGAEGPGPCARAKHAAALHDGYVYVLGGRGGGGALPLRDFWRYSLEDARWERLGARGAAPPALQEHSLLAHGARLYVFGGEAGAGGEVPLWIYDTQTQQWRKPASAAGAAPRRARPPPAAAAAGPRPPPAAAGPRPPPAAAAAGPRPPPAAAGPRPPPAAAAAGPRPPPAAAGPRPPPAAAGSRPPPAAAGPRPPPAAAGPRPRRGHSAHALHDCLLVYGGYMDLKGTTDELWAFHYETETWRQVRTAGAGPARHRHAAALLGARLLVHGGRCDLRACADLWLYDTLSRSWAALRPRGPAPAARCGHVGLRAGGHFYIFGGELHGQPCDELWRFHFATETWDRLHAGPGWPAARVDCAALLLGARGAWPAPPPAPARPAPAPAPAPAAGLLRGLSRLSALHLRRGGGGGRGAYSALARDSTESLPRAELPKSRSAHALEPAGGGGGGGPRPGDEAERRGELAREPASVPDFSDALQTAPRGTRLVLLDSDEEEEGEGTSSLALGFCNPHYVGGERLTPDSGIELQELRPRAPAGQPPLLLLLGGREPARPALQPRALPLWLYRLL